MESDTPITFYDIASNQPLRTFAANPWKTRFALNFKGVHYQTQWVDMPDITEVRKRLGVPANRTLPDGTAYHTLPVISDPANGGLLGDSFEIAQYLDDAYPETLPLFRPYTNGLIAAFNAHVDSVFTKFTILCSEMPFDPRVKDTVMAIFSKRAGAMSVDLKVESEQQREAISGFKAALGELAKAYRHTGGTTDHLWRAGGTDEAQRQRAPKDHQVVGPWLDGDEPVYADFIVGAWLKMFEVSMKSEDWKKVRTWQGGLWGRVVDALQPWSEIK